MQDIRSSNSTVVTRTSDPIKLCTLLLQYQNWNNTEVSQRRIFVL